MVIFMCWVSHVDNHFKHNVKFKAAISGAYGEGNVGKNDRKLTM